MPNNTGLYLVRSAWTSFWWVRCLWVRGETFTAPVASLAAFLFLLGVSGAWAATGPYVPPHYQIQFGPSPSDGGSAVTTLEKDRVRPVLNFLACGNDVNYWLLVRNKNGDEGILQPTIAKLAWLDANPDQSFTGDTDCHAQFTISKDQFTETDWNEILGLVNASPASLNDEIAKAYPPECGRLIIEARAFSGPLNGPPDIVVTYQITRKCLQRQINVALRQIEVKGQIGSSGLPCNGNPFDLTKGEWDVSVRDLTRVLYLDDRYAAEPAGDHVLDRDVIRHIREDLLTIDGPPGESSYSWLQCGNQEQSTGSAQDRADENEATESAVKAVGGALLWFFRRLLLILALLVGLGLLGSLLGALGTVIGISGAAVVAVGAAAIFLRIPETENHRLMIESSRLLNNQLLIQELQNSQSDIGELGNDQAAVKEWLLKKMQEVLKHDFVEYNARPYSRYSINAILNLAEFSNDRDIRTAAGMVLEYSAAKFAVGSHQGRRLVTFRRLMEVVGDHIDGKTRPLESDGTLNQSGIFDSASGADHLVAFSLLLSGQVQQLPDRRVSTAAAGDMVYIASSRFRPDPLIFDLMIRKDVANGGAALQLIHHDGVEIYSSAPSFLITAGGIEAGYSSQVLIGPITTPLGRENDKGAAVPTTLMLSGGGERTKLDSFLRIMGHQDGANSDMHSYDHNLCVWNGFACGINIQIPADLDSCFTPSVDNNSWRFLNSATCAPYNTGPEFFIALWRGDGLISTANFGLFEIADQPRVDFSTFVSKVRGANPANMAPKGVYRSFSGHAIDYNCEGHQDDSNRTGVTSIDGVVVPDIRDLSFAAGDVINGKGDGFVRIENRRLGRALDLDFTAWQNPIRTER